MSNQIFKILNCVFSKFLVWGTKSINSKIIVLCWFIFLFLQWEKFFLQWEKFQNGSWGSKNGPEDPILKFRVKREILKGSEGPFLVPSEPFWNIFERQKKNLSIGKKRKINEQNAFFNFVGFSVYIIKKITVKKEKKHRKWRKKLENEEKNWKMKKNPIFLTSEKTPSQLAGFFFTAVRK